MNTDILMKNKLSIITSVFNHHHTEIMNMDLIPEVHQLLRYKKIDIIDIPQLLMAAVSGHGDTIALYLLSRGVLWCLAGPRANGNFVCQLNID